MSASQPELASPTRDIGTMKPIWLCIIPYCLALYSASLCLGFNPYLVQLYSKSFLSPVLSQDAMTITRFVWRNEVSVHLNDALSIGALSSDEIMHLNDVAQRLRALKLICAFSMILSLFLAYRFRHCLRAVLVRLRWVCGSISAGTLLVAIVDWQSLFGGFHRLLFERGTWFFPSSYYLGALFPRSSWLLLTIWTLVVPFGLSNLAIKVSARMKHWADTPRQ